MPLPERPTRRTLERRAYNLTLATAASALATVVAAVLAVVDVTSFGLVFVLVLVTLGLGYAFSRTVGRR